MAYIRGQVYIYASQTRPEEDPAGEDLLALAMRPRLESGGDKV